MVAMMYAGGVSCDCHLWTPAGRRGGCAAKQGDGALLIHLIPAGT